MSIFLVDRFTADTQGPHLYEQHFHIAPPCEMAGEQVVASAGGVGALLIPVAGARVAAALEPCPFPLEGYHNPTHLCYSERKSGHHIFVTIIVPFAGRTPQVEARLIPIFCDGRQLDPWEATALQIGLDGQRDIYVDLHMQWNLPWEAQSYRGEGRLFHSRCASSPAER